MRSSILLERAESTDPARIRARVELPWLKGTYALKPAFQTRLRPLVRFLNRHGIRANQITVFTALGCASFGITLLLAPRLLLFACLPVVLFFRMTLNAVDGMLARECGQASRLGVYLNELGDAAADVFMILPFAHLPGVHPFGIWVLVVLALITEMAGTLGAVSGSRRYDGPLGKSDRAIVFGAASVWAAAMGSLPRAFVPAVAILLTLTTLQRVRRGIGAEL